MKINSVKFLKGIVEDDAILTDGVPQVAFIGRSNVGKSSLINALTHSTVSRTSSLPGSTQEINIFLVNSNLYFVDLPGYGYAQASGRGKEKIYDLIDSYLFNTNFDQKKVVFIVDASVGMTDKDIAMYQELVNQHKDFVIALSKIDKLNQSQYHNSIKEIKKTVGEHKLLPFSSKEKKGLKEIINEVLG
ncbi:ribosome biogenesis GTP-binding protein YihA/YsxC [Candidatus Nomurabacteria bacterium]|nr:ribosome biogenesis GTP-binding protein YihA/YsxC [Candidatus Nomurabacteria bacterium]